MLKPVRRALISVSNKTGLVELAQTLASAGVEIVSTGSTAATLRQADVPVVPVEQVTGFPECLGGRVKTLHPYIHAGILADRRQQEHVRQLADLEIAAFDLVVVNLYPFRETVAAGADLDAAVEQIDIGGPAMVRGAAKNFANVAVVVVPAQYERVVSAIAVGGFTLAARQELALAAFRHTAAYDLQVANWLGSQRAETADGTAVETPPTWWGSELSVSKVLRYGENPHQAAALYVDGSGRGIAAAVQLHGKEMSYNNFVDGAAAWRAAHDHQLPAIAIIKHANPCGIAVGEDLASAYRRAFATDTVSAFGSVVAANREIDAETAQEIAQVFTEVVVAPGYSEAALAVLTAKKNLRLLQLDYTAEQWEPRYVSGGLLVQETDTFQAAGDSFANWTLVAGEPVSTTTAADLEFAWRAVRAVKSNAILLARDQAAVGIGMGQVSRVDSCRIAVERAGADRARGAVAASDAFFPFADGIQLLIDAGITAVVSPGGSVRDEEVIAAARAAGISLYHTGVRHFFH